MSQGYLKLYLDGRLTSTDDQRRALQQTRDALGALTTLCNDISRVSAVSDVVSPALTERVSARAFVEQLQNAPELKMTAWSGDGGGGVIAANGGADLAHAVAIAARAAFDEAREEPHAIHVTAGGELVMLAGTSDSLAALEGGPASADAREVSFTKGGKGMRLIWAAFVLQRHRVETWTHQGHRASVGFRIPLVHV